MAEPVFYGAATAALSLALYVTTISTMGVIFGQRLQVQGTAGQGSRHSELVAELNGKFLWCLTALAISMGCVVVASISVVWVKAAYGHGEYHSTSFISTGIVIAWGETSDSQCRCATSPVYPRKNWWRSEKEQIPCVVRPRAISLL